MTTSQDFVEAFVTRFPVLRPAYIEHLRDNGELLPHLIFSIGERFTDRIVDAYQHHDTYALETGAASGVSSKRTSTEATVRSTR